MLLLLLLLLYCYGLLLLLSKYSQRILMYLIFQNKIPNLIFSKVYEIILFQYDYSTFDRLHTGFQEFKEFGGKKHERTVKIKYVIAYKQAYDVDFIFGPKFHLVQTQHQHCISQKTTGFCVFRTTKTKTKKWLKEIYKFTKVYKKGRRWGQS